MTTVTLMLLAFVALLALTNWRWGLFLGVVVGLLQDPLRKLVPGQPAYFVVLVGVVFGAAWFGAALSRVRLLPGVIDGWRRAMGVPFALFVALVLLQAFHSYASYGNAMMTGIGLMVWLAPVPAVVVAYQFALRRGITGLHRLMKFYVGLAMLSLTGVYFQYLGYDWRTLGEVGVGLTIYDVGTILKAYSGFFRSSELAAWHTATMSAFVFMLFTGKRLTVMRLLGALALVAVLLSLGLLTGRRKMLVEISIFLSVYLLLVAWFQKGSARMAVGLALTGVLAWVAVVGLTDPDVVSRRSDTKSYQLQQGEQFKGYAVRGQSVFEDIPERVANLGVAPVVWATQSYGLFGAGLGTGSQMGAGNEVAAQINRGAAEGGLGKIVMELGVPGLVLMFWLLFAFAKHLKRALETATKASKPHARLAYGLVGLLAAKVASFSVASQAYSDLFVLLILGWSAGFVLALPVLAKRAQAAQQAREAQRKFVSTAPMTSRLVLPGRLA